MTPRDFAYWLQGYFELTEAFTKELQESHWQAKETQKIVLAHIDLVKVTPGNYDSRMVAFIGWLESCLEFGGSYTKVKVKLSDIFSHVIDPNTPGNSQLQNQVHNPFSDTRC
jgi:hypothetical protein